MKIQTKALLMACTALGVASVVQGSAQAATLSTYNLDPSGTFTGPSFTVDGSAGGPLLTVSALGGLDVGQNGSGTGVSNASGPGSGVNAVVELNETLRLQFASIVRIVSVTFGQLDNAGDGEEAALSIDGVPLTALSTLVFTPPIATVDLATLVPNLATRSGFFFDFSGTDANDTYKIRSVTIEYGADVVPTPALLPGLVGLGLGVIRRRKQQAALA
jgi:hypothetical protein